LRAEPIAAFDAAGQAGGTNSSIDTEMFCTMTLQIGIPE